MNQKIPFHDLSARIAAATGISNESAEQFVKNFFELLSDSLVKGEVVKIKGLGSFAVTGDEGDKSIEFVPDKEMADSINAPFAMFEPVKLNDAVSDRMLSEIERNEEAEADLETAMDESEAPLAENKEEASAGQSEPAEESEPAPAEKDEPVSAEAQVETKEEPVSTSEPESVSENSEVDLSIPAVEANEAMEVKPENVDTTAAATETVVETPAPQPVAAPVVPPTPAPAPVAAPAQGQNLNPPAIRPLEEEPEEYVDRTGGNSPTGGNFWTGLIIGAIVGLALGACAVYLAIDHLFPTSRQIAAEESEIELVEEQPAAAPDTTVAQAETPAVAPTEPQAAESPVAEEPVKVEPAAETKTAEAKVVKDTVRSGYLIINMAKKYYGSKDFWVYIYEENKSKIGNPNRLQPGVELVIPPAEKYGIDAKNPESISRAKKKATEILTKYPR